MATERILLYGISLLLLTAPLPFGAVEGPWSAALVASALSLGVVWMVWRTRRGLPALPWKEPLFLLAMAFSLVAVIQLLPLPGALLELASPKAAELRAELEPAVDGTVAGWRPLSLYPWATRQSLMRMLSYVVMALITVDLAGTRKARKVLVGALVAGGGFQALYGLAEYLSGRQQIFGYVKEFYLEMATGTFINKNHFAGYLAMILPMTLALAVSSFPKSRAHERLPFLRRMADLPEKQLFASVLVFLLATLMGTAVVASHSRAGITFALAGVAALGAVTVAKRRRIGVGVAALAAAGFTLVIFSQGRGQSVIEGFALAPASFGGAGLGRWPMWEQAAGVVMAFPLWGAGLGSFQYVFPGFRTAGPGVFLSHAHNDYLEMMAETGVVGLLVFTAGMLALVSSLARPVESRPDQDLFGLAAGAGVLAVLLHSAIDFSLAIPANALTFAVLAGIFMESRRPPAPREVPGREAGDGWHPGILVPAAVMLTVAAVAVAPVVAGSPAGPGEGESGPESQARFSRFLDWDNADRLFDEAARKGRVAIDGLQSLNRSILDGAPVPEEGILRVRGELEAALLLQEAGIRRAPTYPKGHLYRGHLRAALCAAGSLGEDSGEECAVAGADDFRRALALNPMSAATHAKVARFYLRTWTLLDPQTRAEALEIIERAARMNWDDPSLKEAAAAARLEVAG